MIFTGSILLLLIISATILLTSSKMIYEDGKLYTLATNYSPPIHGKYGIGSGCEAMMPECGVCNGPHGAILHGNKCYQALY